MTELKQFLLWILRRLTRLPRRLHDNLTEALGCEDWYLPFGLSFIGVGLFGLLTGVVLYKILQTDVSAIIASVIWTVGSLFVLSAGVRAMYRAFKHEQDEFIRQLKS